MTHRERESQQQEKESDIEESEEEGEFWVGDGYLGGFGWGTWGVHGGREAIENLK